MARSSSKKIQSLEIRRWLREASRYQLIDVLCLLSGLCLLLLERNDLERAKLVAESMMRAMLIEHSKFPITPFIGHVFDACKGALWDQFDEEYFRDYDFRVACAAVVVIQVIRRYSSFDPGYECDSVLLPGPSWKELSSHPSDEAQYFDVGYSEKHRSGEWFSAPEIQRPRQSEKETNQRRLADLMARIKQANFELSKQDTTPKIYGWRIRRHGLGEVPHIRLHNVCIMGGTKFVCASFIGRGLDDDRWIDSPRTRWPWRYNLQPNFLSQCIESFEQSEKRRIFTPFPKRTRLFHLNKEFQPA